MLDPKQFMADLAKPFPADRVHWRVGSTTQDKSRGMALAYLDGRDVQNRLDEVCGHLWQCRHEWSESGRLQCSIGIYLPVDSDGIEMWVWRSDGAGDTQVEAEKGAFSGAMKRAAVQWGIGRYLYTLPSPWVQLEQRGRTYVIGEEQQKQLTQRLAAWQERAYGDKE